MNQFEYYANDIVMESKALKELRKIESEINLKYSYAEVAKKLKKADTLINDAKFNEGRKIITDLLSFYQEYYKKAEAITPTKFDDFKENAKLFAGAVATSMIPAMIMWIAVLNRQINVADKKTSNDDEAEKYFKEHHGFAKTNIAAGITGAFALFLQRDPGKYNRDTANYWLEGKATSSYTKNDVLKSIKISITNLQDILKGLNEFEEHFKNVKKKHPEIKGDKEIMKFIGTKFRSNEDDEY